VWYFCLCCVFCYPVFSRFSWFVRGIKVMQNNIVDDEPSWNISHCISVTSVSISLFSVCRCIRVDSTTLNGSWSVQQFCSTLVYPLPSPSNQYNWSKLPLRIWFSNSVAPCQKFLIIRAIHKRFFQHWRSCNISFETGSWSLHHADYQQNPFYFYHQCTFSYVSLL
jgi:hypothetical protein